MMGSVEARAGIWFNSLSALDWG